MGWIMSYSDGDAELLKTLQVAVPVDIAATNGIAAFMDNLSKTTHSNPSHSNKMDVFIAEVEEGH